MTLAPALVYGLSGLVLFVVGLAGLLGCAELLRKILAVNIMASGVFLFLVALAHGDGQVIDPVPQAMVLTGIVVSVSSTAVALALACRVQESANLQALLKRPARRGGEG